MTPLGKRGRRERDTKNHDWALGQGGLAIIPEQRKKTKNSILRIGSGTWVKSFNLCAYSVNGQVW